MNFEKTIELNSSDIYRYGLYAGRSFIIIGSVAVYIFCFLLIHFLFQSTFFIIPAVICSLTLSLLFITYYIHIIKSRSRNTAKEYRLIKLPKNITINNTGIHWTSELGTTNISWEDIRKPKETKHAFYFFLNAGPGIVIPKRLLDVGETAVIQEIINKKFPKT